MAKSRSRENSRAEKIRVRKQQSRKAPLENLFGNSATRKQSNNRVPVTRRTPQNVPVINRNRHKVGVPLKTKGAEMQLPSFSNFQVGWRLISGAIFILSLAVVISFSSISTFQVNAINLIGAQRLGSEAILSQLDLVGKSVISLHPEEIEARVIEKFPSLKQVKVTVGLPASLTIQVIERQPLVTWQQESTSLWIDADGIMFPIRGEAEVPLTVIASNSPPAPPSVSETENEVMNQETQELFLLEASTYPITTPEFVQGILSLGEYLPESSQLQYDPQFGLGWQDPNGWLVYFGRDTTDIDIKLVEYQTIISALQMENINPTMISLEFLQAPFYRLEQ